MLAITAVDPNQIPRGRVTPLSAKAVMRLNDVDTWLFEADMSDPVASLIGPGWSIIMDDDAVRLSGRVTSITSVVEDGYRTLEVSGVGELHRLKDRLVYPNPLRAVNQQDVSHYRDSGPAETVLKNLVNRNLGANALAPRRSVGFGVEAPQNRGRTVAISERLSNVLAVAQKIAASGEINFSAVRENNGTVVLRVREPRDLSRQYRFQADGSFSIKASTGNAVVIAQQGEGADRVMSESTRADGWNHRVEIFKDRRDTDDRAVADTETLKLLNENGPSAGATIDLNEGNGAVFGTDFTLGDKVAVQLDQVNITEPVTKAEITWDAFNREVKLGVGTEDTGSTDSKALAMYWDVSSRLRNLESR